MQIQKKKFFISNLEDMQSNDLHLVPKRELPKDRLQTCTHKLVHMLYIRGKAKYLIRVFLDPELVVFFNSDFTE